MRGCDVSILICTKSRAASLARTLDSLTRLEGKAGLTWEVIIADNGSTDTTGDVIRDFARRLPLRSVTETRTGLAAARNATLRAAHGEFLLATDDDCLVAPDWMTTAVGLLREQPMQLIGGRVELGNPLDLPLAIKTSLIQEDLAGAAGLWGFIHGANMAFGRGVVERVGPFDARFGAGTSLRSAEDVDFIYRALRSGIRVAYAPEVVVHHHHGRRGSRDWYRQVGDHAFGFGAMATKYALHGDLDLARALYWDLRSTLRACRAKPSDWRRIPAKLSSLRGSLRFLRVRNQPAD